MICSTLEWNISKASGFITTELDLNDGFIHLSNAAQLPTTLALYFSEHEEVILLLPELKQVQDKLIYEAVDSQSKRSGKFGHLYAELKVSQISKSWVLKRNAFEIPEDILLEAEMRKAAD